MKPTDVGNVIMPVQDIDIHYDYEDDFVYLHPRGTDIWVKISRPRVLSMCLNDIDLRRPNDHGFDVVA